ncbi:MAG: hypothetical protein ACM34M_10020 [Ignavibacteria bacterium]
MNNLKSNMIFFPMVFLFSFEILTAQTFNLLNIPSEKLQFGLRFDKAFYSQNYNYSSLSGVYDIDINIPLTSKLNLIASVPYIYTSYQVDYYVESGEFKEDGLGNIFVGLQTKSGSPEMNRSTISFGVFFPTADDQAAYDGRFVNFYNLLKFLPNSLGFYFNYAYHKMPENGFHYGFEAGPNILIPTKSGRQLELYLHYGATGGYQIESILFKAELIGIAIITEETENFNDRFVHLIDFGFHLKADAISPKIFYAIYLKDSFKDYIEGILGIGLTLTIK